MRRFAGVAERVANDVRGAHADARTLPLDLEALAASFGVTDIVLAPLVEDGRVIWRDEGPCIELRADRPYGRMRFTLAHELAHVLVRGRDAVGEVARRTFDTATDEEELCDAIAAALLLPRDWVLKVGSRPSTLSRLRFLSNRAGVSLSAAAVRLAEVTSTTSILFRWRQTDSRWICASVAAVPPHLFGRMRLPNSSTAILSAAGYRDQWVDISILFGGREIVCRAQISRSGSSCLMLVTSMADAEKAEP